MKKDKIFEAYKDCILKDPINLTSFYVPGKEPKVGIFMQNPGKLKEIAKKPVEKNDLLELESQNFENNDEKLLAYLKMYRKYFVLWLYSNKNFFIPFLNHLGNDFDLEEFENYIKYDNEEEIGQIFDDFYFFDACKKRDNKGSHYSIVETEIKELGLKYIFCFGTKAFESMQRLTGLEVSYKEKGITLQHGKIHDVSINDFTFKVVPVVHMSIFYLTFKDCYFKKLEKAFKF